MKLNDPTLLQQLAYIDGQWVPADSGATLPVTNPATGALLGSVPNMGAAETRRAIAAAAAAMPAWAAKTAKERATVLRRWHDLMDVNAGTIATGEKTIEAVGWELFELMLEVASGRKKTWAEHWKLHNALVLFNPAPVT